MLVLRKLLRRYLINYSLHEKDILIKPLLKPLLSPVFLKNKYVNKLKLKVNLNFYFHTFYGMSKGFMKTFTVFIKPKRDTTRKSENKNFS